MRILLLCFLSLVLTTAPSRLQAEDLIAVVSAYDGELESLFELAGIESVERVVHLNGVEFTFAKAYGKSVVLFKTNISTVNAAMTTQLALSHFDIDLLLFSGIAGGVNPDLRKGDIAIPDRWADHTEGGYFNPGIDPRESRSERYRSLEPFGMFYPGAVAVSRAGQPDAVRKLFFEADPDLLRLAESALDGFELTNAHGEPALIKVGGLGVTGPVFMDHRDYRSWLAEEWGADCVEMESAAIAQVCWANHVPFLIVRAMSDLAGGQEGENEIEEFAKAAEDNSARVVAEILKNL